jgi:hypothetical protein
MVRILDEEDYRRRLDQAVEISTGEEAGLLLKGFFSGDVLGPLRAKNDMLYAKQAALIKARRELLKAIRAEEDRVRNGCGWRQQPSDGAIRRSVHSIADCRHVRVSQRR